MARWKARWNAHTELMMRSFTLLDGIVIDDTALFNEKLREWEHLYNFSRPHSALNGQKPYEWFREKTVLFSV